MATQLVPGPHDSGGPSTSFSSPPSSHPPRAGTSTPHSRSSSPRSFYGPSPDSPTGGSSPTHSASSTPRGSWKRERVLSTKRLPGEAFSPWPGVVEGGEDGLGSPLGSTSRPRTSESVRANSRASKKKEAEDIKVAPWLSADLGAFQTEADVSPHRSRLSTQSSSYSSASPPYVSSNASQTAIASSSSSFVRSKMTAAHQRVPSTDKRRADTGGQHAPPAPDTAVFPAPGSSEEKRKKSGFLGSLIKRKTGVPLGKSSKEDIRATTRSQSASHLKTLPEASSSRAPSRTGSSSLNLASLSHVPSVASSVKHKASTLHRDQSSSDAATLGLRKNSKKLPEPVPDTYQVFALDTDLSHMEGIVNPTFGASPTSIGPAEAGAPHSSGSSSSVDSRNGVPWEEGSPSHHKSSSVSLSFHSTGRRPTQASSEASFSSFTNGDSLASSSHSGSGRGSSSQHLPHSSHKGPALFHSTHPRRPSQLRNVNSPSGEKGISPFDISASPGTLPSKPEFSDPFAAAPSRPPGEWQNGGSQQHSPLSSPNAPPYSPAMLETLSPRSQPAPSVAPPIAPPGAGFNAWVAPESWGVEGDQAEDGDSSDGDVGILDILGTGQATKLPCPGRRSEDAHEELHAFGEQSTSSGASQSRPGTAGRTGTSGGRLGTSGSMQAGPTNYIRIYKADGTYTTIPCQLTSTTADIVQVLTSKMQGKTGFRLFIRERSSERPLDAREKPALIQKRRLMQAGFEESDHLEEMGMEDLSMLCTFVYRLPKLPSVDSTEEDAFDSFEYVDLSGRDLQVFPIFLHRHASTIVHLNLSRNPLQELPSDFIQDCSTLRELRMSNMALKRVPPSIRQSASLTRLDVSCNRIADLDHAGFEAIPGLMSIKVQNNRLSALPSYFGHLRALKYINISNNTFETFPTIVCSIRSLVDLDVSFNAISVLPPEIGKLVNLERLVIVGNVIAALPLTFANLQNLREFDCRRNKIVDFACAYALPKLEVLKAERNDVNIVEARFGPKMREINLSNNSITKISLSSLAADAPSYGLTNLDLSFAKLSSIDDEALAHFVSLTILRLDGNQFTRLPESTGELAQLRELHCTDNALVALPESLSRLQKLEVINVHNNNLKELHPGLWFCSSLETFNASSNLLASFPDPPEMGGSESVLELDEHGRKGSTSSGGAVAGASKSAPPLALRLRGLYLADNRITDDVFHPISLLVELRTLNLSFNEILEIPPWTLRKNRSLVALYLSGNKLTSLPAEDLATESLRSLRVLHVNGNKLQSLPAELSSIVRLTILDVGSNILKYNINNWRYDWNWSKNTDLRYFNLSGNKRLEIKPSERNQYENPMAAMPRSDYVADFSPLNRLRMLGLMDITLRIPLPDDTDDRIIRTTFSEVNRMSYGISDTLGKYEHLLLQDLVVPAFREKDNECLFGIFGRAHTSTPGVLARVKSLAAQAFKNVFADQLSKLREGEGVPDAMRRAFLLVNKSCYETVALAQEPGGARKGSQVSTHTIIANGSTPSPQTAAILKTGASGVIAYIVDKTLYVANAGLALAVVSNKGTAELLSRRHEPFDRAEAARIRAAEGWISPKGLLNDDLEMSRGFGFYHLLPSINARPDIRTWTLTESDEFVILANKELWDFMSYQTAVDIARQEKDEPMMAAQKLRDFALGYGADGSIMVMIISVSDLFKAKGVSRTRQVAVDETSLPDGPYRRLGRRGKDDIGDRTLARLDREIVPPVGMVALVFTDIKNSTPLWETNRGMQTAIKMHNALLRRQLRIIGGYEVKTEGDAFVVSFPSVASAMLWCFTCQLLLLQEEWPREIIECDDGKEIFSDTGELLYRGIWVRMGIHCGNPVCEADPITKRMDYFGPVVNRAARISGAADGGQISVSQDVVQEIQYINDSFEGGADDVSLDGDDQPIELQEATERQNAHIAQLRKLGFGISYLGEKTLKGIPVPEKISLIYPTALAKRLELSSQRDNIQTAQIFEPKAGVVNVEDVRALAAICLRLETLSSSGRAVRDSGPSSRALTQGDQRISRYSFHSPDLLLPPIGVEMTDEDLLAILDSLSIRIENSLSSLYLKQLGGFSSVLASLQQGLQIDSRLIMHALGLFSTLVGSPDS